MNAIEHQMRVMDDAFDMIFRPKYAPSVTHHACEDFDIELEGFSLRFVFDYVLEKDFWPQAKITHAYIVTPTRREIPLELGEIENLDKWQRECEGRVDERN